MFSHPATSTPSNNGEHQSEQSYLSQWIIAQVAYLQTASNLARTAEAPLSHEQIHAIIAIRKRIAASQQSHD